MRSNLLILKKDLVGAKRMLAKSAQRMIMVRWVLRAHLERLGLNLRTGVEDLFLLITTRLVARKTQIERDRVDKARNSILLTAESQQQPQQAAGYACC